MYRSERWGIGLVNLAHMIDGHDADRVALISRNRETTYGELRDQVARLRGGLAAAASPTATGSRSSARNNRYFVISYLAIVGLGAVAVPLNPESPAAELEREIAEVTPVGGDRRAGGDERVGADRRRQHATRSPPSSSPRATCRRRDAARRAARVRADAGRRRRSRPPRGDDVHERHGRSAAGGDAQPRQPARQHRAEPERPRPRRGPTTSCTACCRCSTSSASTSCSACRSRSAPPCCSCSGSIRRRRSSRSSQRRVTIVPGAPAMWVAFAVLRRHPRRRVRDRPARAVGRRDACRRPPPSSSSDASASRSARATASPRRRRS